jgi:hypothetical protein
VSKRYLKNIFHIYLESLKPLENRKQKYKKEFFVNSFLGEKFDQILKSPT